MKKFTFSMLAAVMLFAVPFMKAQSFNVKQVIVASGGNYADPDDFVSLSSYNPVSDQSVDFGTVFTQSVQDVIVIDDFLYVAAQDSIAKYDLNTFERMAIAPALGVNKLIVHNDKLVASFAYPATENFVREFNSSDLTLVASVFSVSDESAGMLISGNRLYVAVPGSWASTVGKIAMIDLDVFELLDEVDLGAEAAGIHDLYLVNNQVVSVCISAWGSTTGNLMQINTALSHFTPYAYPVSVGAGVGVINNQIFVQMNNGIGSIDLETMELVKTEVVPPFEMTIAAAELDTVNGLFYITTTDYSANGAGMVYSMTGEEQSTFDAGISAEALAIDYSASVGVLEGKPMVAIQAYPNPAIDQSQISIADELQGAEWMMSDIQGNIYGKGQLALNENVLKLPFQGLQKGLYFVSIRNNRSQGMVKILLN